MNSLVTYYFYETYIKKDENFIPCSSQELVSAIEGVVKVDGDEGGGSGFVIDSKHIITNNHVVLDNPNLKVSDKDGKSHKAHIYSTITLKDLALIELEDEISAPQLKWSNKDALLGEDVYAVGFPRDLSDSLSKSITKGIVSSFTRDPYDNRLYIQTDAALNPGNSGGPLLNQCGKVIGINTSSMLDMAGINFALIGNEARDSVNKMFESGKDRNGEEIAKEYPNDPAEVVSRYYINLARGNFENAYNFFSTKRKSKLPKDNWIKGISDATLMINLKSAETTSVTSSNVNFLATEYKDGKIQTNEFKGEWNFIYEGGLLRMNDSNIKQIN